MAYAYAGRCQKGSSCDENNELIHPVINLILLSYTIIKMDKCISKRY